MVKKVLLLLFLFLTFQSPVLATIGVGVGTGKILITEKLKAGIVYKIPPVTVVNTGDEPSDYSIGVAFLEKQPELKPDKSWFAFSPLDFHLNPGQAQQVNMTMTLPLKVIPGKYFAYLEGFPAKKAVGGKTTVGIAAASKLYFEIAPSNLFEGIYYRAISVWRNNEPWTNILGGIVVLIIAIYLFRHFFKIEINVRGKDNENEPQKEK